MKPRASLGPGAAELSLLAIATLGLAAIGLRVVAIATETHGYYRELVPRQAGWLAAGAALAAGIALMPTRWLRRLALPSLLLVPLPALLTSGHDLVFAGVPLVSHSFLRLAPLILLPLILALSSYVAGLGDQVPGRIRDYAVPPVLAAGVIGVALAMPSVPTAVVAFGIALVVLSLVRWPWWTRLAFVCVVGTLPLLVWCLLLHDYQRARIVAWMTPERDAFGAGYALHQSLAAIRAGGWLGAGEPWSSAQPLPSALSDMPFTLWVHQHGLLGGLLLLALFGLVMGLALRLAWTTRGPFFRALGVGVAAYWLGHVLLSIGGGVGLLPLNGSTLPLVSFGGSGTVAALMTLGLLAHIARRRLSSRRDPILAPRST